MYNKPQNICVIIPESAFALYCNSPLKVILNRPKYEFIFHLQFQLFVEFCKYFIYTD